MMSGSKKKQERKDSKSGKITEMHPDGTSKPYTSMSPETPYLGLIDRHPANYQTEIALTLAGLFLLQALTWILPATRELLAGRWGKKK